VPNRGLIVDRNGVVLATNYSAYTLEITPRRSAAAELEALIDELARWSRSRRATAAASSACWRK
jgi:penicillin-binding protein 2